MRKNALERVEMVKAMDTIIRNLNDEEQIDYWLRYGVADHDEELTEEDAYLYADDDDNFKELMRTFQVIIANDARHNGGFYVDGVIS